MNIKQEILAYLTNKEWVFGGTIERDMGYICKAKGSNISRRLRELVQSQSILVDYVKVEGVKNKVARYRIRPEPVPVDKVDCVLKQGVII